MSGVARRVVISGRVQGVGYRAWVEHQAHRLGLQGWVRNRRDGSVEAIFEGSEDIVSKMIAANASGVCDCAVDIRIKYPRPSCAATNSPITAPITAKVIATLHPVNR